LDGWSIRRRWKRAASGGRLRAELVDKDELFPPALVHPVYRIGAYKFGGERDVFGASVKNRGWQLGLGGDVTFYSKPSVLDLSYGSHPVSLQILLRLRPARSTPMHGH
jgi:hypothetical protein